MRDQGLTDQQIAFAEGIVAGKLPHQAAIAAGYQSRSAGSRLMSDEKVRDALKLAAFRAGLTVDRLAEKLHALVEAQRFELSRDGAAVHLGPDNRAQLQAIDIAVKLLGGYPNPRIDVNTGNQNVLVIRSDQSPIAALDPFGAPAIDAETVELPALGNPELGIAPEDDFLIG